MPIRSYSISFLAFLILMTSSALAAGQSPKAFGNDPTQGKWLPDTKSEHSSEAKSNSVTDYLKPLHGRMRLLGCGYQDAELATSKSFSWTLKESVLQGKLHDEASKWTCTGRVDVPKDRPDALDLQLVFKLVEGEAKSSGIAVAFDFSEWNADNYVLLPAAVYNGNRNRIVPRGYAAGLDRADLYRKDLPITTADLPQLSPEVGKPSRLEVNACNVTTPAMCFYNRRSGHAFILLAEQGIRLDGRAEIIDNGLMIEESLDRSIASFVVSAPGVRERKPEFVGFSGSPDRGADFKVGDEVKLRLRLYSFETKELPGLWEKLLSIRKEVTGLNQPRNLIPFSEITRRMTQRIDSRFHEGKEFKFYCPENANWISFGWVGGLMDTFPMLALGDEIHLDRVSKTFDFAIPRAQGKAGYFYGLLTADGKCRGREGYDDHPEICLTRKNGDVLFWMLKQFLLLKAQGRTDAIKPEWERNIRRLADAFAATWKRDGQWGNFVNVETGEVAVYNSTGGAMAIGGLALASEYFHEPEYRKIAEQAAEFYYERDVLGLGMTTGGSADILQNADTESANGFMTSLMALYETTGDMRWLDKCRTLANLTSTWIVSHDYELPPQTELARLGAKLTGTVWASTQNKHGAPGFCTSAGDPLFNLYRALGDRRYSDLLRDIVHAHAEGIKPNGQITERLTYCDADSRGNRGGGSTGWCELNGFLMALELPGIYLRTDRGECIAFDHVNVNVVRLENDGVLLRIENPTPFPAKVAILAENAVQAKQPLGYTAFLKWPKIELAAGETGVFRISPEGKAIRLGTEMEYETSKGK